MVSNDIYETEALGVRRSRWLNTVLGSVQLIFIKTVDLSKVNPYETVHTLLYI